MHREDTSLFGLPLPLQLAHALQLAGTGIQGLRDVPGYALRVASDGALTTEL